MKVNFQAINYKADEKLIIFAEKRIEKCHLIYDRIIDVTLFTKVENISNRINKQAEIRIRIPGEVVMVKKICKSFEQAIDSASDAAERILKKRKEKIRA